jgi:hypothetical protein
LTGSSRSSQTYSRSERSGWRGGSHSASTLGEQYDSLRQPGRSRLRDLHDALDRAVLDVYGFDPDEDLLAQILALNLSLAELEQAGGAVRGPGPQGLANTTRSTWRIEPVHRLV